MVISFGTELKNMRERLGLTQKHVAIVLGLESSQSISNIERDVVPLPFKYFKPYARLMDMRMRDFYEMFSLCRRAKEIKELRLSA